MCWEKWSVGRCGKGVAAERAGKVGRDQIGKGLIGSGKQWSLSGVYICNLKPKRRILVVLVFNAQITLVLFLSLRRQWHFTLDTQGDVSREEWKLRRGQDLRVVTLLIFLLLSLQLTTWAWLSGFMVYYLLLTAFIFTKWTSDLKICTEKPWIHDNSSNTNNNKTVELYISPSRSSLSHFRVILSVKTSA